MVYNSIFQTSLLSQRITLALRKMTDAASSHQVAHIVISLLFRLYKPWHNLHTYNCVALIRWPTAISYEIRFFIDRHQTARLMDNALHREITPPNVISCLIHSCVAAWSVLTLSTTFQPTHSQWTQTFSFKLLLLHIFVCCCSSISPHFTFLDRSPTTPSFYFIPKWSKPVCFLSFCRVSIKS